MTQQPDDLVERLRKVEGSKPDYAGIQTLWNRNPDGPEAADRIEADAATITALRQQVAELGGERDSYKAALEEIAAEHDAGRHDGLPEPCPALEDVVMWHIARTALERRGSE